MINFDYFIDQAKHLAATLPLPSQVNTLEREGLRYRLYRSEQTPNDLIIVYHGGGVHLDAGYDILARQITQDESIAVCLVDIRGHGGSTGAKGQLANVASVWRDVDTLVSWMRTLFPHTAMHLLGHSSGAGMLINYFTRHLPQQRTDSLIFLAPELGPFAPEVRQRTTSAPFARVSQWPFIINALSGGWLLGNYPAVRLNFPDKVKATALDFVQHYSVNMANALTPRHPAKQLAALPLSTSWFAAGDDELFSAQAMAVFAKQHGNTHLRFQILEDCSHLNCVFCLEEGIQQHLNALRQKRAV
ncbi:alpha/beta fold hydrolase [Erwinia persicina]|uniref:alpha/beta fold hydrolase n=1 Tax=Erwinia persicina TaxID=55211 RepID=UPI001782BECA|nr:alpha/beta fold hydrolase [Erwinia persicina]MBD8161581.1 alpha/beta fold hydrolase [Erwinia persicina]MBD8212978.1 alpha/beta fold hydrolase [Erwinia persicina]